MQRPRLWSDADDVHALGRGRNGRRPSVGPLGGEDAGQADNQVRRTVEMIDSQRHGYGVIAEGNVARPACRRTYAACATRSELIR
jgi:hypothetical protein